MLSMEIMDTEPALSRSLRHLVAAFAGRTDFAARRERPARILAEDRFIERLRESRERIERRDFERAWKTY
jgi:hypothetical protein